MWQGTLLTSVVIIALTILFVIPVIAVVFRLGVKGLTKYIYLLLAFIAVAYSISLVPNILRLGVEAYLNDSYDIDETIKKYESYHDYPCSKVSNWSS